MSEHIPESPDDGRALPAPRVVRANRFRFSLVWLVPIVALMIGASLLIRNSLETGPRIEIEFNTAEGLEAGKTEVRFKEVAIGRVERVSLRDDRKKVIATVRLDRSAAGMAREDTQFWVVRPRIGTAGITGLGTLLSGVYIGVDAGVSEVERTRFAGLESPPFMLRGEPGSSFALVASDLGSLDVGSPIYYRRTKVGRVVGYSLDPKQDELTVKIFVEAPYNQLVTPQTRFWNASGVDLTLNASGLTIDTQTLSSVLAGGVAFDRLPSVLPQAPAADGSRFMLFNDRNSALAPPDGEPVRARMVFDQSVRGLAVDAPVDFLGVEIGKVSKITLQQDVRRRRFPVEVMVELFPQRLGSLRDVLLGAPVAADNAPNQAQGTDSVNPVLTQGMLAIQRLVAQGLKAQMRTGNLLTGQLYIALDFFTADAQSGAAAPRAVAGKASGKAVKNGKRLTRRERREERAARLLEQATEQAAANGVITLPTVAGTLSEIQPQVAQIVEKLSRIPFDAIGRDVQSVVGKAEQAITRLTPEAVAAVTELQATLAKAQASLDRLDRNVLAENSSVQIQAAQTLAEMQRAAQSLRVLADYLQRNPQSLIRGKPPDEPLSTGRGVPPASRAPAVTLPVPPGSAQPSVSGAAAPATPGPQR